MREDIDNAMLFNAIAEFLGGINKLIANVNGLVTEERERRIKNQVTAERMLDRAERLIHEEES